MCAGTQGSQIMHAFNNYDTTHYHCLLAHLFNNDWIKRQYLRPKGINGCTVGFYKHG